MKDPVQASQWYPGYDAKGYNYEKLTLETANNIIDMCLKKQIGLAEVAETLLLKLPDYQKNILNDTLITSYTQNKEPLMRQLSLINQKKHSKDSAAKKFIDTIITNHPTLLLSALDQLNPYLTEDVYFRRLL